MSERLRSLRAQSASARIGRSDAVSEAGGVDHPCDFGGCPFLVGKGGHEHAVAHTAIRPVSRQPGVPRARHPLRRAPPVLKLLSLLSCRVGSPRVAVASGAGVVPRRSVSSRAEEHVPDSELTATSIPRAQAALEIRLPYAINP
jgi:hypothetical protein